MKCVTNKSKQCGRCKVPVIFAALSSDDVTLQLILPTKFVLHFKKAIVFFALSTKAVWYQS